MKDKVWHIAGVGAIGGLLAGYLCRAGHGVQLILKNNQQLTTYKTTQLTVISQQEQFTCHPPAVALAQVSNDSIDYLICSTKAYDAMQLLSSLQSQLHANSVVVLTHNGLGILDEIKIKLPHLRIIFAVTKIGAYMEKPFTIRAFMEEKLHLGTAIGQFSDEEISTICTLFKTAQIPACWESDIHLIMWEKFALNCCINLLTVIFSCKNGGLLEHTAILKNVSSEVMQVLVAYDKAELAPNLLEKLTQLIENTANNYSSMYKDVQNNKPTELPYLNEQLVKLARQKNIPTPFNNELLIQFYSKFPIYPGQHEKSC